MVERLVEFETIVSQAFPAGEVDPLNPSRFQDGNVLDRLCERRQTLGKSLGKSSCEGCVFYTNFDVYDGTWEQEAKVCAHHNAYDILAKNDIEPAATLIVSFGGEGKVGIYDKQTNIPNHPFGWEMAQGYNAFFATDDELEAIAGRAADCSIVKVEFELPDEAVTGFGIVHLTRDNIQGDNALSFGENGDQSYLTAALLEVADYYGIGLENFTLTQIAKIDQLDYRFAPVTDKESGTVVKTAETVMDERFAGWFEQGFLHNLSNPDWKRGDPILPSDQWKADYQLMTEHIIKTCGVPLENIDVDHAINPGIVESGHASNAAANDPNRPPERRRPDARDLYMVAARRIRRKDD